MSRITRLILSIAVITIVSFVEVFAAVAPSSQTRFISFSNLTANSVDITMVKGNGNNRIVVVSTTAITDTATFGVEYTDQGGSFTDGVPIITGSDDRVVDVLTGSQWQSTISNLSGGQTYYVKVFEYNKDGANPITAYNQGTGTNNPRSFSTPIVVNAPNTLAAANVTATTADLSWVDGNSSPVSDGYIFTLYVDDLGEGLGNSSYVGSDNTVAPYIELDLGNEPTFELTDLVGPSDYKFEVIAYIGNTNSVPASFVFFTPQDNTEPQLVSITMTGGTGTDDVVYEEDNGDDLEFVVTFNEKMKTWLTPSFTFENPTPLDLSYVTGFWNNGGTVFTATVNFAGTTPQENLLIDVTIGNAEDLAGNPLDLAFDTEADLFNIDNVDGSLTNFNYSTAGTNDDQPVCKSAVNNDVIEFEIDLSENGYAADGIGNHNFVVVAEDQNNENQIVFSSTDTLNGTYLFTATLAGTEAEDNYNLIIQFTDGAGNVVEDLSNTSLFRIDNTAPIISSLQITGEDGTCLSANDGDVLEFTFEVVEEGCGTFNVDDVSVSIDGPDSDTPSNSLSLVLTSGDGSNATPYLFTGTLTIHSDDDDGIWDITIDATDDAGNAATQSTNSSVFTVDNTAPTITNVAITPATCVNNTTELTLTFDVTDVITSHCGAIDNSDIIINNQESGTGSLNFAFAYQSVATAGNVLTFTYTMTVDETNAQDDTYTVEIDVDDKAGNSAIQNTEESFTVDNTKPVFSNFTITGGDGSCLAGGSTLEFTVDVVEAGCGTFNSSDINIGVTGTVVNSITADGGNPTGTGTYTFTLLIDGTDNDGDYQLTFDGSDDAGNAATQYAPAGVEFSIDNTAPVISNVAVDKTCVNGGTTVTLSFDVAESGCGVFDNSLITISDNATTANSWTYSSGTGAGTYEYTLLIDANDVDNTSVNVTVDADDAAGNSATPVTNTGAFAIDNTDPTVTIDDPIATAEVNSSKVIDFTENDGSGCGTMLTQASVNGGTNWTTITTGVSTLGDIAEFGPLNDGAVTLTLRTTDGAGNVSSPVTTVALVKDATPPTVSAVTPSDQEISLSDDGNVFTITIDFNEPMDDSGDNDPVVTITSNVTLANTNLGGSWSTDTRYIAAFSTVDANTPVALEDLDVTISGAKDDTEDDGNQMIEDNTTGADNFSIDTEAPTISFDGTSPAADDCVRGIETVEFTAADASAFSGLDEVRAKINFDDDYEVVTSGFALEDLQAWDTLSQGTFTLYLLALDDFGNTTEITRDLNKDDVSPIISALTVTPSCVTTDDVVTITFSVEEEGCGTFNADDIELTIDDNGQAQAIYEPTVTLTGGTGTNADPYDFSATFTILSSHIDGEYVVTVTATDDAGNSDSDSDDFDVDQTPPTLSNLVTSSVPGGSPTKVGGSAPNRVLTIAFNEVTDGCANFDNGTITYIITGPGNTALTVSPAAPTKTVDTWTTTVTVPANEPTGNYQIKIIAADDNGNADTLDPAGVEFVIDNTKPQVSNVTTSHTPAGQFPPAPVLNRADDDGGSPEFYIDVVYNEPLDPGQTIPTLEFHIAGKNPTTPVAALTLGTPSRPNSSTLRYPYNLDSNTNLDMRAIGVRINGASDAVGNIQTSPNTKGSLFGIDFETPQLVSVTPTPTYVVDGSSQLGLLFEFTENMITNVKPTVSFDAGNGPDNDSLALILTYNEPLSTWNSATLFTAKFDVDGSHPLDSDPIAVGLSGATDDAGNPFPGSNETGVFIVDTKEPTCVSLVTDPVNPIVNLGDLDFDVTIVMDQALDNGITPTITFATSSAFTVSGGAYTTTTNTNDTYTFTVTHNGTTEEEHQEIMTVTGFKDINGNVQIIACVDTFDVDTDRPDIVSLTVSDSKICGDDHGNNEVITITFDEVMDSGIAPVITFDTDIVSNGILTFSNGVWSNGDSVYTATYAINASSEFTINDVDVIVNTAEDLLGNVMLQSTTSDTIDVDTELPSVTGIAFNPVPSNAFGVNRSNIGPNGFQVVVTFDEAMDNTQAPSIVFNDPFGTGTSAAALTISTGSWSTDTYTNDTYTQLYTVNDAVVELDGIDVTLTNAKDACGNVQATENPEPSFAIDLIAPTCVGISTEYSTINENRLEDQILFVDFSEEMDESIDPEFNFAVSGNFTVQNDGNWDDGDEYSVSAYHNGTEEGRFTETVTLNLFNTQPKDLAGNPVESASCSTQFDVDTKKPLVSSVTFSPTKVIGTTTTFSVDVEFNEAMENVVIPTLSFSAGSGAFALQQTSDWDNSTHYIFDYVVTDNDIEETDVTVTINAAEDNAGNVMLAHVSNETFNIDQVEPTITGLSVSDALINKAEANDGGYTFVVTATFSEEMNPSANPSIEIAPDVTTGTISLTLSGVPTWNLGYTEVEWTYLASDAGVALEGLEITITGGEDACGNATDYTAPNTGVFDEIFSIDTENPTILFGQSTPLAESCVNGEETIDFSASDGSGFSGIDEVQGRINGGTFATCTTGVQLNALNGWPGTDGSITLELKALDLAGNETTISRIFTADVTAPVISNVQFTNTCVTTGDVVTLTFDIAENGCGTFDSDDISISEFENGFVADGGNPTGSGTYTFTLLIDGDDTEGLKSVTINATDEAGNDAIPSVNNNAFTIDKTAPTYSLFGPPSPSCANSSDVITLLITSEDIIFSCGPYGVSNITASTSLGAANVTTFGAPLYLISVDLSGTDNTDDGIYDIDIVMTDAAGNVRNETITNAFTIDNTAPVVSNVTVTPGCENGGGTVTLTFDVVENGCGTFNKDDITIVDDVATNFNWTWVSGTGSGTYTYTLLIDGTDPDGDVDVSVNATDDAGNSSTGNDIGDTDFTIDNTAPTVAFTDPTGGETVNDSKVIDYTATDGSGCGINVTEYRFNSTGSWTTAPVTGTTLSGYTGFSSLSDGAFTLNFRSTDVAGNIGTSNVSLTKDATGPDVTSVTPSDNLISIADNGTPFTIAVLFNEGMDTGTTPVVTLDANNTVVTTNTGGTWSSGNTIYTATFGTIDALTTPETITSLGVTVSNVKDDTEDIGNSMDFPAGFSSVFSIDTEAPTCFDITNNNADIYENDLSVTVSVQFTEDMATSPNPTFIITGTTELTPGASNWSGDTFTQTFTHSGVEEETSAKFEIDGFAALPTDLAGNPVSAVLCSTDVDIDTRKPLVTSVVFSTSLITESTTSLDVTVNFDEDMSTPPTIEFNTLLPGLLTYNGVSSTSTSFTYNYSVADANLDLDDITVDVAIGEDVAGNVMLTHTSTESFDIDQVAPTINTASIKSSNSINDQFARGGHDILLTFTSSEALNTGAFTGNIAGYGINSISSLGTTYTLSVNTDNTIAPGLVTFSIEYEDVNGNSGATLVSVTDGSSVTVDKTAPIGTINLASGQADPTSDSPINFALTFDEDVYGLTDSDIDISGTAGATNATVTTINASSYNVAVSGMTGSGTVVINLSNNKVTDVASNGNMNTVLGDNSVQYDVSGATDVAAGAVSEPATLSSLVDTQVEAVLNFDFDVTDDGVVPAADVLATLITDISISQGTGNDFGDWTTIISGAILTDGTNTVSGTVGATTIAFTGLAHGAGQIGEVKDDSTKTYTLKVWLSDSPSVVIDNENLAFKVNRSSFTVDGGGSSFVSGAGTAVESGSSNNAINVVATKLLFTTTPVKTVINTNTTFVVEATDVNDNRDVDYGPSTVTLTADQSTISSGGSGTMTSGTLTLSTVQFSDAFANDSVTANDGSLTGGSSKFNIKDEEPASITNFVVSQTNAHYLDLSWNNPDGKNTLILAKKSPNQNNFSYKYSYTDEAGMDDETGWIQDNDYDGVDNETPNDNSAFVIYAGSATSIRMDNLERNNTIYGITAYAYAGTLNGGTQNFNETETQITGETDWKEVYFSDNKQESLELGIYNITPQPANLNNNVSLQVKTIEDMPLTLELYDSKGQLMMTLFEGRDFSAGETPFEFNLANTVSSGQHFLRLTGNGHVVIAPLMIVK